MRGGRCVQSERTNERWGGGFFGVDGGGCDETMMRGVYRSQNAQIFTQTPTTHDTHTRTRVEREREKNNTDTNESGARACMPTNSYSLPERTPFTMR